MKAIQPQQLFRISNPKRRYTSMARALQTLYRARPAPHYVALTLLIACYLDAMAAKGGRGTKPKFLRFLNNNFKQLCAGLDSRELGMDGAEVFYAFYRSEMAHTFFSRKPIQKLQKPLRLPISGKLWTKHDLSCAMKIRI